MLGERSPSPIFKACFPAAQFRVLQCSPHTTAHDLITHFETVKKIKDGVVVLEEVGLAEMSPEMPICTFVCDNNIKF